MSDDAATAIEFANSWYAVRGRPQEGIDTYLRSHNVNIRHVDIFVELRDAIREVFAACVAGTPAGPEPIAVINRAAAAAPRWPVLDASYGVTEQTASAAPEAALATFARAAIDLLAGPLRADLRACLAPGCVKFFLKDHPRREWCCDPCGNRARAARHYRRHREPRDAT